MNALVLGAATSGRAASGLLRRSGHDVIVYDSDPAVKLDGFEVNTGQWSKQHLAGIDLVVASPGFAEHSDPIQDALAAGIELCSELELGWRHVQAPVVAVTGTNGKTTAVGLIADMARQGGMRVAASGNIGLALSEVADGSWDLLVVEASSFQLRFADTFRPDVAVVLNVAPDHLDWHDSFETYAAAKARIFEHQTPQDHLVYDGDDPGASDLVAGAVAQLVVVSGSRRLDGGGIEGGKVWVGDTAFDLSSTIDAAFGLDVAAAAAAAAAAGVISDGIEAGISSFAPGPHRRSLVASAGGIDFVDDSKATNPHAAVASAKSYPSVVLIAGGIAKGLDLSPLVDISTVRHIVAVGEAAASLAAAGGERVTLANSMADAVSIAKDLAEPGDTVLLAPGCSSFDMYSSYAERGDKFAAAVLDETI